MANDDGLEHDASLLAAFRRGDRDALAAVYRRHVDEVAQAIRRGVRVTVNGQLVRVGNRIEEADVEVAVQDTFVRAFSPRARLAYDGLRPFGAWLATIARNLLIDRARAVRADRAVVSIDAVGAGQLAGDSIDPDWAVEATEFERVIAEVAAAWSERDQALFRLRFVDGLTQKEAAAALGLSGITVRRLDAQLRASVLEALRDAGHLKGHHVGIPQLVRDRTKG